METVSRYSRNREAIQEYLLGTKEHPTADVVYHALKAKNPSVSLGTVYRNLNQLAEQGRILKLSMDDGSEHFDGNPLPHHHFTCRMCGRVLDLDLDPDILKDLNDAASADFNGVIEGHSIYFYGLCSLCKK